MSRLFGPWLCAKVTFRESPFLRRYRPGRKSGVRQGGLLGRAETRLLPPNGRNLLWVIDTPLLSAENARQFPHNRGFLFAQGGSVTEKYLWRAALSLSAWPLPFPLGHSKIHWTI